MKNQNHNQTNFASLSNDEKLEKLHNILRNISNNVDKKSGSSSHSNKNDNARPFVTFDDKFMSLGKEHVVVIEGKTTVVRRPEDQITFDLSELANPVFATIKMTVKIIQQLFNAAEPLTVKEATIVKKTKDTSETIVTPNIEDRVKDLIHKSRLLTESRIKRSDVLTDEAFKLITEYADNEVLDLLMPVDQQGFLLKPNSLRIAKSEVDKALKEDPNILPADLAAIASLVLVGEKPTKKNIKEWFNTPNSEQSKTTTKGSVKPKVP